MKNATCYGTGVIGVAWAAVFLKGGCNVTLFDLNDEIIEKAKANLKGIFDLFVAKDILTADQAADCLARASFTTDPETAVKNAEFIQENCPEKLELKQSVIATIEKYAPADAIICSSTSGLLISDIAANAEHKERIVGGHPYNPVYVIPLVEITKGKYASDENVAKAKDFYLSVGKDPVVLNFEVPGFICNRIQMAVNREAYDLVYRGVASVEDVDKCVSSSIGLRYAFIGPHLCGEVGGGPGGIKGIMTHIGPATKAWLEDMAKWTEAPADYPDIAQNGVNEAMAHRAPGTGQNHDELSAYMANGVIDLLKLQGRI